MAAAINSEKPAATQKKPYRKPTLETVRLEAPSLLTITCPEGQQDCGGFCDFVC